MDKTLIEHLEYELRMLIGAALLVKASEEKDLGNTVNYFKDAVYLHARNLYNFFFGDAKNDESVKGYTNYSFNLDFYEKWRSALHLHVLHIRKGRDKGKNVKDDEHLNEQIKKFSDDIVQLWQDWIRVTTDNDLKQELISALSRARAEAGRDYDGLMQRLASS